MAHVGVLLALEEAGVQPVAAAGTSFGAIVAALHALGVPPAEMRRLLTAPAAREVWAQGLDFGAHRFSMIHGRRLERWLDSTLYHGATFADLQRPLVIATTSLSTGDLKRVTTGSLARAVLASSSLPLLFSPVQIDGEWLVDGGFIEAVPFRSGHSLGGGRLLGINTGIDTENAGMVRWLRRMRQRAWARDFSEWSVSRPVSHAAGRALRGLGWAAKSYARAQIMPDGAGLLRVNPQIAWWDFHRMDQAVEAGLAVTRQAIKGGLLTELTPVGALEVEGAGQDLLAATRTG